jgi:hypothetical protein
MRGRLSTFDHFVLTSLDQLLLKLTILLLFCTKQATLMWRSTVLILFPFSYFSMVGVYLDIYDAHPFFKSLDELERDMSVKEVSWDFDILKFLKRKRFCDLVQRHSAR